MSTCMITIPNEWLSISYANMPSKINDISPQPQLYATNNAQHTLMGDCFAQVKFQSTGIDFHCIVSMHMNIDVLQSSHVLRARLLLPRYTTHWQAPCPQAQAR